jgi:hypothetical protein
LLSLQLLFQQRFSLMQPTEFVDVILVLPPHFDLVAASGGFVFFCELLKF